jgi:hypothetical protein
MSNKAYQYDAGMYDSDTLFRVNWYTIIVGLENKSLKLIL